MEVYVLDKTLTPIKVIDAYKSLIWTVRYYQAGDFELYLPASNEMLAILTMGRYLVRPDNDRVMIIKKIEIQTDVENGNFFIVSGPSAEILLNSRIVWSQTNLNGNAEECVYDLVNENIISPEIPERAIPNFKLRAPNNFTEKMTMQVTGDKVDDAVKSICIANHWGWKVTLDEQKNFVFGLFKGKENNVVFSPENDNLINSKYHCDITNVANTALVAGEGEGTARKTCAIGTASGIDRIEIYVDARDISSNDGEIDTTQYHELLAQRGHEKLNETVMTESFEGEVEPNMTYKYKEDYDIGDLVRIKNEYGIEAESRIIEIIESYDETGYRVIPTFADWSV